jgi:biotin operon repressor
MENIIASNQEFVKRITSIVPANKGHTRYKLADKVIKVKMHNKPVDMRYVIMTDKLENHCLLKAYQENRLNNVENLPNEGDFLYGPKNLVSNSTESKSLSDKDLRAVSSWVFAPNSIDDTTKGSNDTGSNKLNIYTIGFDTEWGQDKGGKRRVLSYQLSIYIGVGSVAVLIEFILFPNGHRISLSRLLSIFTQVLWYEFNINIGACGSTYKKNVFCYLVAHYSIVDVTTLLDGKKLLKYTDTIRRTQVTVEKPLKVKVYDKDYNWSQQWIIKLRDTLLLAPANSSLEMLANAMGKIKLELPEGYDKDKMDVFLKEQEDEFMLYACNDATIALDYVRAMYPDGDLPVTLGSEGANIFREKIMELNKWKVKDFDYHFRGLVTVRDENRRKKLEPRPEAVAALEMANHAYYGGRNECFLYGIHHANEWNDYDLTGAYPTAMSMLRNPDFTKISSLTGDIINIDPLDYIFGYVEFEFPDDIMYPCLPIKDKEGRGLIFPKRGRTYASAPELYLALRFGARVRWVQPGIYIGSLDKYDIREALTDLLKARAEAKKLYGKGSVQEIKIKEIVNSIYGKTAQGLSRKRNYSTRTDSVEDLPPSIITQPLIAAMTTSLVRAKVTAAMHQLHELGYQIASVTTDGFLTDAPFDVLNGLSLFGFRDAYKYVRYKMVGDDTMWETKHKCKTLIMITTRGNLGLGKIDDYKLPAAKAGYKPEPDFHVIYGDEITPELVRRFLKRTGKLEMQYNKLPAPKEYIRKNADGLSVLQKKRIEWEFDLKRRPNNTWMETVTIDGETYEHLSFDTVPWESMDDFIDARAIKKAHPELYPLKDNEKSKMLISMIKEKEAVRRSRMLIQSADKGGIYRTATISYLRDLLSGREPMPSWMQGLSYKQLADAFNERLKSLNITLSVDDFKNAKRRSNKQSLEHSEALELVKSLLK